jgi:hypothetical protein
MRPLPDPDTPPLRLLERRAPRRAPAAAVVPARPATAGRLSAWLRRLVPNAR